MNPRTDSSQTRAVVWGTAAVGIAVAVAGFRYWIHTARARIDAALTRPTACEVVVTGADRDVASAWQRDVLMEADRACAKVRAREREEARIRTDEASFAKTMGYPIGGIEERCAIADAAANDVPFDPSDRLGFLADRVLYENLIVEDLGPGEPKFVCIDEVERSGNTCTRHVANFFRAMRKSLPRWPSQIDPSPRTITVLTRCASNITPAERRALVARTASVVSAARADRMKEPRARRLCALAAALGESGETCGALDR
jgi:hypothetical protein